MVFDSYRTLVDYFHFMLVQNSTQFMHSFEASQKKGRKVKKEKTFKEKTTVAAALATSLVEHSSSILTQVATFLPNSLFNSAIYVR